MVCLKHKVHVSVHGCEVSLSLCLYLQMYTFERIESLWALQCNWCWNQHRSKSLHSAACTGFKLSAIHYRYVCTLWRTSTYIVLYNLWVHHWPQRPTTGPYCEPVQYSSYLHKFSLILYCITCCGQIHPFIIHIFKYCCSDPKCVPQSVQYIFFGLPAFLFHTEYNSEIF